MKFLNILTSICFVAVLATGANAISVKCRTSGDCPAQCMQDLGAKGCEKCRVNCRARGGPGMAGREMSVSCETSGDCPDQCMDGLDKPGCENCHLKCKAE